MPVATTMLVAMATLLMEACSNQHVYEYSVDVNTSQWTPTDTLFYPVHVDRTPADFSPIECYYPYCMSLVVRYNKTYPAPVLPLRVKLDREYCIRLDLGDSMSMPDGDTWGSYLVKEFDITRAIFSFPDSGDYALKIWPEECVTDVVSISTILE